MGKGIYIAMALMLIIIGILLIANLPPSDSIAGYFGGKPEENRGYVPFGFLSIIGFFLIMIALFILGGASKSF